MNEIYRKKIYDECEDFEVFCNYFFSKIITRQFNSLQRKMIAHIQKESTHKICVAPRGLGKTTIVKCFILHSILYSKKSHFVLYVSKTITAAIQQTESIKAMTQSPNLIEIYGSPFGKENQQARTKQRTLVGRDRYVIFGTAIQPVGYKGTTRGVNYNSRRPDIIIIDDFVDQKQTSNPTYNTRTADWLLNELGNVHDVASTDDYYYLIIDTIKSPQDVTSILSRDSSWDTLILQTFDDAFKTLDPEYMPQKKLDKLLETARRLNHLPGFYLEYNGVVKDFAQKIEIQFVIDFFTYAQICVKEKKSGQLILSNENFYYAEGHTMIIVDPARSVKATSNTTGYLIATYFPYTNFFIIRYAKAFKDSPEEVVTKIFSLCQQYKISDIGIESTGLEQWVLQPIQNYINAKGLPIVLHSLSANNGTLASKKKDRFDQTLTYFDQKKIFFIEEDTKEAIESISQYPYPQIWDLLDCFSYLLPMITTIGASPIPTGERLFPDYSHLDAVYKKLNISNDDLYKYQSIV
jgi:hypothetical protein